MEIIQSKPLSIVILQDGQRLFAETRKEDLTMFAKDSKKYPYLEIQGQMISTVTGNIRTIRDAKDTEYYEFFVLERLPKPIMEKMYLLLSKAHESNQNVTLEMLMNKQKTYEDEESNSKGLTPEQKENRRNQVIRMNKIMVEKGLMTQGDAERITKKILSGAF